MTDGKHVPGDDDRAAFEAFLAEMDEDLTETIDVLVEAGCAAPGALGFRPRSLEIVERVAIELSAAPATSPLTEEGLADFVARYFGETLVRTLPGCVWVLCDDAKSPARGLPAVRLGEGPMVAPHLVAEQLLDFRRIGTLRKAIRDVKGATGAAPAEAPRSEPESQ
jgi:hypothetical protein